MASSENPVLPPDKAAFFLGGAKGTAWAVHEQGERYVVALRDDNVCAVFAQHASAASVRENFIAMVSSSPDPLSAEELEGAAAGPNSDVLSTIAYSWSRPKDKVQLVFTLTTSSDPAANLQAMASMSLAKKPNNSFQGKPLRGSP